MNNIADVTVSSQAGRSRNQYYYLRGYAWVPRTDTGQRGPSPTELFRYHNLLLRSLNLWFSFNCCMFLTSFVNDDFFMYFRCVLLFWCSMNKHVVRTFHSRKHCVDCNITIEYACLQNFNLLAVSFTFCYSS